MFDVPRDAINNHSFYPVFHIVQEVDLKLFCLRMVFVLNTFWVLIRTNFGLQGENLIGRLLGIFIN